MASNLESLDLAPAPEAPAEVVADKGYHAREVLKRPADGQWRTRIAEPARRAVLRWQGDDDARRAVYATAPGCSRRRPGGAPAARGAVRAGVRAPARSRRHAPDLAPRGDNVAKRYGVQVAGYNLRLLMRTLFGAGTPKAAADAGLVWLAAGDHLLLVLLLCRETGPRRVRDAAKPQPIGRSCVGRSDSRSRP